MGDWACQPGKSQLGNAATIRDRWHTSKQQTGLSASQGVRQWDHRQHLTQWHNTGQLEAKVPAKLDTHNLTVSCNGTTFGFKIIDVLISKSWLLIYTLRTCYMVNTRHLHQHARFFWEK